MLRSSIPFGRLLGVEVRVHASIPVLFVLAVGLAVGMKQAPVRGAGLWAAMFFAIVVREVARAIAAAYAGLRLRVVFLLPVGGVMAFEPREPGHHGKNGKGFGTRAVSTTGPIANFAMGLLLMGAAYSLDPQVQLLGQPWISTGHVLRSFVWMQFLLGAVSLLPASTMPTRQLLRMDKNTSTPTRANAGPSFGLGTMLAVSMMVSGFLLMARSNLAYIGLGLVISSVFVLINVQMAGGQSLNSPEAESILVREVMLTEYTLLSTTDTLRDALTRTTHSMQDVFPVVRGERLVGSVARQTISERLLAGGDTYLQGVMSRSLQIANPGERLTDALRRAAGLGVSEFIPVVEDGAMLGILTPQSLQRAVGQLQVARMRAQQEQANDDRG